MESSNARGKDDHGNEQQTFKSPGNEHSPIREHAHRSFSGERDRSAFEGRTPGSLELLPGGRPLDKEARRFGPLTGAWRAFGNGVDFDHVTVGAFGGLC